jgi:16S rRNA (cytosine1402-N4)-methyltransferase
MTLLEPLFNRERQKKEITKVFQAIRIEVNHEMGRTAADAGTDH